MTPASSVRHQRPFPEHMATLHQQIDNLVYAAEQACPNNFKPSLLGCAGCNFVIDYDEGQECGVMEIRNLIGDHFQQSDIPTAGPCVPCQPTQPECGKCTGRKVK